MRRVIGFCNLHNSPSLGELTKNRTLASTSFLGRFAFIDFTLSNFSNSGVDEIGILCHDHVRSLTKHLGFQNSWNINTKIGSNIVMYNEEKFNKIEKRIIDEIIINESIYDISINVVVSYITNSGKYSYRKNKIVKYQELCDIYMQWRNSKKYDETSKRERKYMNDKLRYDVLKRDNFKCKKCGISAKDGAKLHVDHIIPVSKGGKTTISNLQTLCDRCNLGKSDKLN